jgi:GT2 family glycosyltransferase
MTPARPTVSVVVPFAGTAHELSSLLANLAALELATGDELIVADNRADGQPPSGFSAKVVPAHGIHTPAYARNCGAQAAGGDWLVFIDADTRPAPSLIDAYFRPPPDPGTAILAGAVRDIAPRPTLVARHSVARGRLDQQMTMGRACLPYAQTANCAVRRSAFAAAGGFAERARAGEDADLCFRLREIGWAMESRSEARVEHRSRETVPRLARQLVGHGSGAAWLNRRYPGSFPPAPPRELAARIARSVGEAVRAASRREREAAAFAVLDLVALAAFESGRLMPNERRDRLPTDRSG